MVVSAANTATPAGRLCCALAKGACRTALLGDHLPPRLHAFVGAVRGGGAGLGEPEDAHVGEQLIAADGVLRQIRHRVGPFPDFSTIQASCPPGESVSA